MVNDLHPGVVPLRRDFIFEVGKTWKKKKSSLRGKRSPLRQTETASLISCETRGGLCAAQNKEKIILFCVYFEAK